MATRSLGTLTLDLIAKIGGYVGPLDKAARTTKKNANDMSKDLKNIGIAAAALGSTAAIAFAAIAKASINVADDLSKASQQVGVSVESLSALKFTAGLAGVESESLVTSLDKFNKNISEAAFSGTGAAAEAFATLNINLRDTDGQLKATEVLFSEVADRLSQMEDGARKTALAQELLGKSGAKLIPLLNAGAQGLREGADEALRLGQVIGTDAARAAEEFNDNISRLQSTVSGVATTVAMSITPALAALSDVFADPKFQTGVADAAEGVTQFSSTVLELAEYALPLLIGVIGARLSSAALASAASFTAATIESARYQATLIRMAGISSTAAASQVALGVATRGASAAMLLVGGPAGAAILAGAALIYLGTSSSDAQERLERLRKEADQSYQSIEKMGDAAKELERQRLSDEIEAITTQLREMNGGLETAQKLNLNSRSILKMKADIELLNSNLDETKKKLEDLNRPPERKQDPFTPIISPDDEARLSKVMDDEFERMIKRQQELAEEAKKIQDEYKSVIESLEKQITLYGDTTRAAETRYDLEHGYLKGINEQQKEYLINLAAQLDLLDQQKELMAELDEFDWSLAPAEAEKTEEFLKFTEDAAERINGAFSDAWMNIDDGWEDLRDGIVDSFKRMLAEMAHEALTKPIVMQVQQVMTGGGASAAQQGGNAVGAIGAGGVYAAVALAVVAGVSIWNKKQDEKFAKMTAEYRQATQSMGTILGEANKKSESIGNSIELLTKLADETLGVNANMLNQLMQINNNIGGLAAGIARQFGNDGLGDFSNSQTGTSTLSWRGIAADPGNWVTDKLLPSNAITDFIVGFTSAINDKVSEAIYSKKVKIKDSGIKIIGQSLADILESGVMEAYAYADVNTKKKVLGVTTSNKMKERLSDLDDAVLLQFTKVFEGASEALRLASGAFGIDFEEQLQKLKIDTTKLSLKGLEGDALTAEIEAFFGSTLDEWAEILLGGAVPVSRDIDSVLSGAVKGFLGVDVAAREVNQTNTEALEILRKYQKVGEGAFATMIRLAGETEAFSRIAEQLAFNFDLVGLAAIETVQELANTAGGFEQLAQSVSNYATKFMSQAEQIAFAEKLVTEGFGELGLAVPKTREAFVALVQGLDLSTEQGREQFTAIMNLVDASDQYISALEEQAEAAKEAQRSAIGGAFESLTQAVQAERDVLDKIHQTAIDGLQKSLTEHQAVANSLSSALSNMSLQSSKADLLTRRAAQAQVIAANAIAKAGGPLPTVGQLDAALDVLARPSEQLYETFEDYARDFYATQRSLEELQAAAAGQVSIDELNLKNQEAYHAAQMAQFDQVIEFYQAQLDSLDGIDTGVVTVAEAIHELTDLLRAAGLDVSASGAPLVIAAAQNAAAPYAYTPLTTAASTVNPQTGNYVVADLLSEVRELRTELERSQYAIAKNTLDTRKILDRWDGDGLPPEREEAES